MHRTHLAVLIMRIVDQRHLYVLQDRTRLVGAMTQYHHQFIEARGLQGQHGEAKQSQTVYREHQ